MDVSIWAFANSQPAKCTHIPIENLPQQYIAYHQESVGEEASQCSVDLQTHTMKRLRSIDDSAIRRIVTDLAQGAQTFFDAIRDVDTVKHPLALDNLPDLLDLNFEPRCELLGVSNVVHENRNLVEALKQMGFHENPLYFRAA